MKHNNLCLSRDLRVHP